LLEESSHLPCKVDPKIAKFLHLIFDNKRLKKEVLG
jgi:poly [ADP-ribose] polymerase 2/3/4